MLHAITIIAPSLLSASGHNNGDADMVMALRVRAKNDDILTKTTRDRQSQDQKDYDAPRCVTPFYLPLLFCFRQHSTIDYDTTVTTIPPAQGHGYHIGDNNR